MFTKSIVNNFSDYKFKPKVILKTRLPDYKLKYVKNMSGKARCLMMELN